MYERVLSGGSCFIAITLCCDTLSCRLSFRGSGATGTRQLLNLSAPSTMLSVSVF